MNKTSLFALSAVICLATKVYSAQQDPNVKIPIASIPSNTVELGTINSYDTQTIVFRLTNTGEAPLNIQRITPTCNCISGKADKTVFQPKEEGVITLSLDVKLVHGTFKRVVWLDTDDPKTPRILLTVKGTVQPLFEGLPPMPISYRGLDANVVWTNTLTLTASETNMFLGMPSVQTNEFVKIDVSVKTNAAEKMSYTVTCLVKPIDPDLHNTTVSFPVTGKTGSGVGPVRIQFQTKTGAGLTASPNRILLNPAGATAKKRIVVHTSERIANTNLLTWTPAIEGVTVAVDASQGLKSNIILTMNVSNEATQRLLKEPDAALTINYPNHKPVKLPFVAPPSMRAAAKP